MTEIEEVAEAIHALHPELWPLSQAQARYVANAEASDQGHTVVSELIDALLRLNPQEYRSNDQQFEMHVDELEAYLRGRLQALVDQQHQGNIAEFAKATGYSRSHMSRVLSGQKSVPIELATVLGVRLELLVRVGKVAGHEPG